jgi:2-aminoadipate transaminase
MIPDLSGLYSKNALNMKRSLIRELLKLARQPEIISFAGGMPDPQTFPVEALEEISAQVLREKGATALQYGPTEGEPALREALAGWLTKERPDLRAENILVTSGSQQALDLLAQVLIDPGDPVIVELPSYIGALQAFAAHRARMIGVPQDDEGIRTDLLEKALEKHSRRKRKPKFIYVIPDFQNPSGVTLTLARRQELLALASRFEVPLVEDSPYRVLRFRGEPMPTIYSLDPQRHVLALGTFSKIFCPGMRLGWLLTPEAWMERFVIAKQGMDLCSPSFTQFIAVEYIRRGLLDQEVENTRVLYGRKLQVMLVALEKHMPRGVTWTHPEGGLFLWVKLPRRMNATELFEKAVAKKVAYVIGSAFFCNGKGHYTMRLNFSYPTEEQIEEGIRRLAGVIRENLKGAKL